VIGGAAGAFPPMIGWAAVSGDITLNSILLFMIIFIWTPPHFWALALYKTGDYEKVGIPMMPNVKGPKSTRNQIMAYSVMLAAPERQLEAQMKPRFMRSNQVTTRRVTSLPSLLYISLRSSGF